MNLETRLEILSSAGTITESTKNTVLSIIEMLHKKYDIRLTEENGAMMTTHLAMAIMRVKGNDRVKNIEEVVFQETLESEHIEKAKQIYKDMSKMFDVTFPKEEEKYMLVNICVILENS